MGLKGYRLWVMGQLDSTCRAPPLSSTVIHPTTQRYKLSLKAQSLKPGYLFIGSQGFKKQGGAFKL
jgi:hypothetical protein